MWPDHRTISAGLDVLNVKGKMEAQLSFTLSESSSEIFSFIARLILWSHSIISKFTSVQSTLQHPQKKKGRF
jgi:hypothetical protein